MLPYWLMFALWSAGALQAERRRDHDSRILFFVAAAIATTLMIGLRYRVGGDWLTYQDTYDDIYFLSLRAALTTTDMGYAASNWLAAQGDLGIWFVNVICGVLFMAGLARLAWKQPNPSLAVLVAIPYLIIVVAMGYTRQAAAIGILCLAIADASERHLLRLIVLSLAAALFHKTAVLVLPILLIPIFRRNALFGVFGGVIFLALSILVLRSSSDRLITNYVQGNYDSQGAAIRVSMNAVAAALFVILRKKFDFTPFQASYWMTCSLLSFAAVPALFIASASSGIDRISLYIIPLQVVVYSQLPYVLSKTSKALPSVLIGVVGYSFTVQFVWLHYAAYSFFWLPYRTVLQGEG